MDIVAAKFPLNIYAIPIFAFESDINFTESTEHKDIILSIKRKYGSGLVVQL